jgi:hypothetical protein
MDQPPRADASRSLLVLIEPSPLPGRLVVAVVARSGHGDSRTDRLLVRRSVAGDLKSDHVATILREAVLAIRQTAEHLPPAAP